MRKRGRPKMVETPEEFDRIVDEYVDARAENGQRPLLTGMMLALGIYDYEVFYAFEKREGFAESVSRARTIVADGYEDCLSGKGSPQGAMFALKNIRGSAGGPAWQDKIEVDVRGNLDVSINIDGWADDDNEG